MNMCLSQWQAAYDRMRLEAYEQEVRDLESPDYHG